jgi:hypothetical protein
MLDGPNKEVEGAFQFVHSSTDCLHPSLPFSPPIIIASQLGGGISVHEKVKVNWEKNEESYLEKVKEGRRTSRQIAKLCSPRIWGQQKGKAQS